MDGWEDTTFRAFETNFVVPRRSSSSLPQNGGLEALPGNSILVWPHSAELD